MDAHVTKPVEPEALFAAIRTCLKQSGVFVPLGSRSAPESAGERAPSEEETFPSLPGITVEDGLRRLGGNAKTFRRILAEFAAHFRGAMDGIHRAVDKGDTSQAMQLVHALKGASGNISAKELQKAALELELALSETRFENLGSLLANLGGALSDVTEGIQKLQEEEAAVEHAAPVGNHPRENGSPDKVADCLNQLATHIREYNPVDSEETMTRLLDHLDEAQNGEDVTRLSKQISELDFDAARQTLIHFSQRLGIDLGA